MGQLPKDPQGVPLEEPADPHLFLTHPDPRHVQETKPVLYPRPARRAGIYKSRLLRTQDHVPARQHASVLSVDLAQSIGQNRRS